MPLVHQEGERERIERHFTGCRQVARVDNGHGVGNEEWHAAVRLCEGTTRPWSELWPDPRRFS